MRVTFEVLNVKVKESEMLEMLSVMLKSEVKILKMTKEKVNNSKKVKVEEKTYIFEELLKEHEEVEEVVVEKDNISVLTESSFDKKESKKTKKEQKEAEMKTKKEQKEAEMKAKKEQKEAEIKAKKEQKEAEIKAKKEQKEAEIKAKKEAKKAEAKLKAKAKREAKKAEKLSSLLSTPVLDSDVSNTDEVEVTEEEEDECIKINYEGKEYIKSIKTNVIYNMDEEVVGNFNEKTKKIEFDEEFQEEEYA